MDAARQGEWDMSIHWIGECHHLLKPTDKPFGNGGTTLKCIYCGAEMLDCEINRTRYDVETKPAGVTIPAPVEYGE